MKLGDLLTPERIHLGVPGSTVSSILGPLLERYEGGSMDPDALLERLQAGEGGGIRTVSGSALIVHLRTSGGERNWAALAVTRDALPALEAEADEELGVRILVVLRTTPVTGGRATSLDQLSRVLRDPTVESRILKAESADQILEIDKLVGAGLEEPLRVEHVLVPMTYRVFPDTPVGELVDLMARRGLQALPVVGKDLQVLGVVTAEEALEQVLVRRGKGRDPSEDQPTKTARDVMSRSVMCVPEDQALLDAARLMVNKKVPQLLVVREGEVVGVLTRDAILGALYRQQHGEHERA